MAEITKTIWIANDYAVSFCGKLSGKKLRRRSFKKNGVSWVTFYDAKTLRMVFDCNAVFAVEHFSRQLKIANK